jgi:hypothetical protein
VILGSRFQRVGAAVVVTVVTLALIGAVIVTTTPLGCGPAKSLHIKLSSARCQTVASLQSPSPYIPTQKGGPTPGPFPQPVSSNPYPGPATYIPNPNPYSNSPYPDSGSGGFPYIVGPASGAAATAPYPLTCTLPIYAGGPGSGGFILFPGGQFQPDPRSAVAVASPSPGTASPPPQTQYPGFFGLTYDRAYTRWLPVPYRWVSPDGKRYAYPGVSGGIYVQNVAAGTQVELGEGTVWQVLDVGATGVYAVTGQTGGLWLLPFGGGVTTITTTGYWQAVWGTSAYGTATSSVPNGVGNNLLRLDIPSGTVTDFFSRPQSSGTVVAFSPNGNPVIYVYGPNGLTIWTGLGATIGEIADLYNSNFYPNGAPIVDSHGIWLGSSGGTVLHVSGQGWYFMSVIGGQLAGGCD